MEKSEAGLQASELIKPEFLEVYDRWITPIYRYFLSYVGEAALAEDLTSQLFLKAYQAYPKFQPRHSIASWLFRIAHNLAMDHFRGSRRSQAYLNQNVQSQVAASLPEEDTEALILLRSVLAELDVIEQDILRLRYLSQFSFAEIGQVLNLSEGAVKKKTYRLLRALRERIGGEDA